MNMLGIVYAGDKVRFVTPELEVSPEMDVVDSDIEKTIQFCFQAWNYHIDGLIASDFGPSAAPNKALKALGLTRSEVKTVWMIVFEGQKEKKVV